MGISVQCDCGKRIGVSDVLAGKTIKCPACGNRVFVAPAGAGANAPGKSASPRSGPADPSIGQMPFGKMRVGPRQQNQTSSFYISKGKVVFLSVLGGIALLVFLFKIGPLRVHDQWHAMEPQVNGDVSDVITFGLQAYLSQQGLYDPNFQHHVPAVDGPCTFLGPILSITMPEKIVFRGKSTQGNFVGTYNTRTGDVVADVEYGGYTVAGMVDVQKATGSFRMTGRMADGHPQAEVDGVSLQIVAPPPVQQ